MAYDEKIGVRCSRCERPVAAEVCGKRAIDKDNEPVRYALLLCPYCDRPFLIVQEGSYEQREDGEYYTAWGVPRTLYPAQLDRLDPAVPENIAKSYIGARRCFDEAGEYTAAAIMCRRTLEGICSHFGAAKGTLKAKLDELKSRGIIEARLYEWADDVLRALGNDAAHDVDTTISKQDALDALEFTKAIVEYLYVFEAAFRRFKERREPPAVGGYGSADDDMLNEGPPS
jgi:hypothetical protein